MVCEWLALRDEEASSFSHVVLFCSVFGQSIHGNEKKKSRCKDWELGLEAEMAKAHGTGAVACMAMGTGHWALAG